MQMGRLSFCIGGDTVLNPKTILILLDILIHLLGDDDDD